MHDHRYPALTVLASSTIATIRSRTANYLPIRRRSPLSRTSQSRGKLALRVRLSRRLLERNQLIRKKKADRQKERPVHTLPEIDDRDSASLLLLVSDVIFKMDATDGTQNSSDHTLVCPKLAEAAALRGIGKFFTIRLVCLHVTLKQGEESQAFSFSRSWTAPSTVLQVCMGPLVLFYVK